MLVQITRRLLLFTKLQHCRDATHIKVSMSYNTKGHFDHGIKIRQAAKSDCNEIARLIQELADFEKMPDGPKINAKVLEKDGFESNPSLFSCFVAESPDSSEHLIGYALYYFIYSTWRGKALFLEDLYCTPDYRKKKVGSSLFRAVCKEAILTECQNMDFQVLEWNPASKFYLNHGAVDLTAAESWHLYRMSRPALELLD